MPHPNDIALVVLDTDHGKHKAGDFVRLPYHTLIRNRELGFRYHHPTKAELAERKSASSSGKSTKPKAAKKKAD